MCVRICIWIYMCKYVYIYMCVCVMHAAYIYIYIYVYIYIHKHLRFYSKGWIFRFHASACQLPWPSSDLFGMPLLWRHSVVVEWRVCVASYIKMKRWRSSNCQVSLFKTNGLDQVQKFASDSHPAADHHLWFIIIIYYSSSSSSSSSSAAAAAAERSECEGMNERTNANHASKNRRKMGQKDVKGGTNAHVGGWKGGPA